MTPTDHSIEIFKNALISSNKNIGLVNKNKLAIPLENVKDYTICGYKTKTMNGV